MEAEGFRALIVYGSSANWGTRTANIRYLTGGFSHDGYLVFPLEGMPTYLIWLSQHVRWFRERLPWMDDIRGLEGSPLWADSLSRLLAEKKCAEGTVGLVGLGGYRNPEGLLPYGVVRSLEATLPKVRFRDATNLIEDMRFYKSDVELQCIRTAASIGDRAVQMLVESAKPGITERLLHAEVVAAILRHGGDYPPLVLLSSGSQLQHAGYVPGERVIESGDLILNEITPRVEGYNAQPHYPVAVGGVHPIYYDLFEVATQALGAGLRSLKLGSSLADVETAIAEPIKSAGFTTIRTQLHGIGLEAVEPPTARWPSWTRSDPMSRPDLTVSPGMALVLEPHVLTPDRRFGMQVGITVVVTEAGAEPVGTMDWTQTRLLKGVS